MNPILMSFSNQIAWSIFYFDFPYLPTVITIDTSGNQIYGAVNYSAGVIPATGTVTVTFGSAQSGTMELR
jgi:hypothetical protein